MRESAEGIDYGNERDDRLIIFTREKTSMSINRFFYSDSSAHQNRAEFILGTLWDSFNLDYLEA